MLGKLSCYWIWLWDMRVIDLILAPAYCDESIFFGVNKECTWAFGRGAHLKSKISPSTLILNRNACNISTNIKFSVVKPIFYFEWCVVLCLIFKKNNFFHEFIYYFFKFQLQLSLLPNICQCLEPIQFRFLALNVVLMLWQKQKLLLASLLGSSVEDLHLLGTFILFEFHLMFFKFSLRKIGMIFYVKIKIKNTQQNNQAILI